MSAVPDLPPARSIRRGPLTAPHHGIVVLAYDERLLRRRRLVTAAGEGFLVDLPTTTGLDAGDAFELEGGRLIAVAAAEEALIEVRGDLPRLAWHIGNRHAPCRIEAGRLLVKRDHVMADMLRRLGAELREIVAPFEPEGGAYGHGRTMGHDHGHGHGPDHSHDDLGALSSLGPSHAG